MIKLHRAALRGLAIAGLALSFAATAHADLRARKRPPVRRAPVTFDVSGVYSGVMNGKVVIGGTAYRLDATPRVYQIGLGRVSIHQLAIGSMVFASGTPGGETGTIRTLIARPANERTTSGSEASSHVRVRDRSSEE